MSQLIPTMPALLRASSAVYLDAARNGDTGARERKRTTVRLPHHVWENIQMLSEQLIGAFPNRYVTLNSTLEFLVNEGIRAVTNNEIETTQPPPSLPEGISLDEE